MKATFASALLGAVSSFLITSSVYATTSGLSETLEVQFSSGAADDLAATAEALGTPVAIYEHVRNDFEYALYHGAHSSSVNTFGGKRGNDVDLASTLIAMLRSQGYPARYVVGTVRVSSDAVNGWLGVRDVSLAKYVMDDQGIQEVAPLGSDPGYVEFEHVWVEVQIPYSNYRGLGTSLESIDCENTPEQCMWVSIDASYKQHDYSAEALDLNGLVPFEYDAFYEAIETDDPLRRDLNPVRIYEDSVQAYLSDNFPGIGVDAASYDGRVVPDNSGLLPSSLPYEIIGATRHYDSVADHDAAVPAIEPERWAKDVTISLLIPQLYPYIHSWTTNAVTASDHGITFSLEQVGGQPIQAVRAGSTFIGSVPLNGIVSVGDPFAIAVSVDGPPAAGGEVSAVYQDQKFGGHMVVAVGGEHSNFAQFHRATDELLSHIDEYPIVFNATEPDCEISTGIACTPYVDTNESGAYDVNDMPLLEHSEAMTALTGGLLNVAARSYFAQLRQARDRLGAINHVFQPIAGWIGLVSSVNNVEYIEDTAFSVLPGGLLIDLKALVFNGCWRLDFAQEHDPRTFELLGHVASALEHEVWQQLIGYDAVSTVRGIQFALADGASLQKPEGNSDANNMPAQYSGFQFYSTVPPGFTLVEFQDVFGTKPVTWSHPVSGSSMEVLRREVDAGTPAHLVSPALYESKQYNAVHCIDEVENQLEDFIAQGQGNVLMPTSELCGVVPSGTVSQFLVQLEDYFFNDIIPNVILQERFDYFDADQGFDPDDFVYRARPLQFDQHSAVFVSDLRDEVMKECELTSNNHACRTKFTIPSVKTTAGLNSFSVYITSVYDDVEESLSTLGFNIRNEGLSGAGGGYVDLATYLEQSSPSEAGGNLLPNFENDLFTDKHLIGQTNNDLIRTPSTADPVSTVTGNMYLDEVDLTIKGRGLDIVFTRTYNSGPARSGEDGPFGYGWTHNYAMRLRSNDHGDCPNCPVIGEGARPDNENSVTGSISYVDERGGEHLYIVSETTQDVTAPPGEFDVLALDTPITGQHTLTFQNGVKYVFEATGGDDLTTEPGKIARLAAIQDPYGNELQFSYDSGLGRLESVSDNLGVQGRTGLTFTYHGSSNHIHTASDWTGRTWEYLYDTNGEHLETVINPLDDAVTYGYAEGTHFLDQVLYPELRSGNEVSTSFRYYENGKAYSDRNSLGQGETLDYDLYRRATTVTDARGHRREYSYDANGALVWMRNADGGIQRFKNTERGLRCSKEDALGYLTRYSFRADRALPEPTDVECPAPDAAGLVRRETDPFGNSIDTDYGAYGQPTVTVDKRDNTVTRIYYTSSDPLPGKLKELRATVNGTGSVLLESYSYYETGPAFGQIKQKLEYFDPVDLSRKRITDYVYDASGINLVSKTVSGASTSPATEPVVTTYSYDDLGRVESETLQRRTSPTNSTPLYLTTAYEYDALDRVVSVTNPNGDIAETIYDANGKIYKEITYHKTSDPRAHCTAVVLESEDYQKCEMAVHAYDESDRRVQSTNLLGQTTTFAYDAGGNVAAVTDSNGHSVHYQYDSMGRRNATTDANGHRTHYVYDLAGRMARLVDPNGNATKYKHDALGRVTEITTPLGRTTRFEYDENGNQTKLIDANGILDPLELNAYGATEYRAYDELGRLILVVDALDQETSYTYDLLGNITEITDAKNQRTEMVYDDLGRLREIVDPLEEVPNDLTVLLTYDEAGNVLTRTDRKGQTVQFTYDTLNRLRQSDYLADSSQELFAYDDFGDLISVGNAAVTYTYAYDSLHRLTQKTDSRGGRTLSWTYDAMGNVQTKTDYQGEVTHYQYDSANRLVSERNGAYLQVSYHYDGAGRLLNRILSNGVQTDYVYDGDNLLTSLVNRTASGDVIHEQSYGYDEVGNIKDGLLDVDGDGTGDPVVYTYDAVYRLLGVDYPGTANDESYTYDAVGNRKTFTRDAATLHYLYDAGNRLNEIREGSETGTLLYSYEYDANGNRAAYWAGAISAGTELHDYVYDAKDRIAALTVDGLGSVSFAYDPRDYRVEKQGPAGTRKYYLEAEHLEAVYDGSDALREKYLRGVVVDEVVNGYVYDGQGDETNLNFHHDHLRSVTGISTHTGEAAQQNAFTAFGNQLRAAGAEVTSLRYTGREFDDETGLYYYRARFYDPLIGRFLQEDPIGFDGGINLYAYVNNNPVNANDPSGEVLNLVIGGGSSVALGYTISLFTGQDYTWSDVARDAALGAVGAGIVGKATQLYQARHIAAPFATKLAARSGSSAQSEITTGIYFFEQGGASYVGQGNIGARLASHVGNSAKPISSAGNAVRAAVDGGKASREVAEQFTLLNMGGVNGSGVLNKVNPIGAARRSLLTDSALGNVTSIATPAQSLWNPVAAGSVTGLGANAISAGGGFVLYPSKPNTNMIQNIYSK